MINVFKKLFASNNKNIFYSFCSPKQNIVAVTEAFDQIRNSTTFSKVMTLILSIGNYMNSGSRNAESIGFEINYLNKVSLFLKCLCLIIFYKGQEFFFSLEQIENSIQ